MRTHGCLPPKHRPYIEFESGEEINNRLLVNPEVQVHMSRQARRGQRPKVARWCSSTPRLNRSAKSTVMTSSCRPQNSVSIWTPSRPAHPDRTRGMGRGIFRVRGIFALIKDQRLQQDSSRAPAFEGQAATGACSLVRKVSCLTARKVAHGVGTAADLDKTRAVVRDAQPGKCCGTLTSSGERDKGRRGSRARRRSTC